MLMRENVLLVRLGLSESPSPFDVGLVLRFSRACVDPVAFLPGRFWDGDGLVIGLRVVGVALSVLSLTVVAPFVT